MKSILFVVVQFACLVFIGVTGRLLASEFFLLCSELGGLVLACWAILTIGPGNVNVKPDVRPGAVLVTRGPYRFIRHPMYTAMLLATSAVVLDFPTILRFTVWLLLLVNTLMKLYYEESLLSRRFGEYDQYRQRTKRLIPLVY